MTHHALVGSRRGRTAVVALAAVALLAAGCGHDDEAASVATTAEPAASPSSVDTTTGVETTAAAASTSAAVTKEPLKVGLLGAITGPSASGQRSIDKIAGAWQEWVNANGGVNGHPVEIVFRDSANDPAKAAAVAKELVEQEGVISIALSDTSVEDAVGPYLQEQRVPVIGSFGFSSNVWGKLDNFFPLKTSVLAIVAGPVLAAKLDGATTFGAVVCAENSSCAQAEELYKPLMESMGIGYAGLAKAGFEEPSYTAQCLALMGNGADYIQINLTTVGATRLVKDCIDQGYTGTFGLANGTALASAMSELPAEANVFGVIDGFPWWVTDGPAADFHAAMDAAGLTDADFGNSAETALWASLEMFRTVMADAPDAPTRDDVFAAIYSVKDEDLGGLLPQTVTFSEGQVAPALDCFWYYRYSNGEFSMVEEDSPSGNSVSSGALKSACFTPG